MEKDRAQKLIAELEKHQKNQIQCLQALLDLTPDNGKPG